jgi:hypothetical protein
VSRPLGSDGRAVRTLASHVVARGEALWSAGYKRRARWLGQAFEVLASEHTALGRAARAQLPESSGLGPAMVSWALTSTLQTLTSEHLLSLAESVRPPHQGARPVRPGHLCALILAGNVFTASARGAAIPLLLGWPVLAKASSSDDVFPRLLEAALAESDPALGDAFRVTTFAGDEEAHTTALLEQADAVSAYGSDRTLNDIRASLGATVSFIPHGHGLGAAFVASEALTSFEQARSVARKLAADVAAYDQRGCLSPLVAWVGDGGAVSLESFGELVAAELEALQSTLPRGTIPLDSASAQLSWRGIGAMRGHLIEGSAYAVSTEERGTLRLSPGYRNLQLLSIENAEELPSKLAPLGVHLKCLGLAGVENPKELVRKLPARVAPRLCPIGSMQEPPLHALQDGVPAWEGLVRWAEL